MADAAVSSPEESTTRNTRCGSCAIYRLHAFGESKPNGGRDRGRGRDRGYD